MTQFWLTVPPQAWTDDAVDLLKFFECVARDIERNSFTSKLPFAREQHKIKMVLIQRVSYSSNILNFP